MGLVRQIAPRNVVSARNASVQTRYDYDTDGTRIRFIVVTSPDSLDATLSEIVWEVPG